MERRTLLKALTAAVFGGVAQQAALAKPVSDAHELVVKPAGEGVLVKVNGRVLDKSEYYVSKDKTITFTTAPGNDNVVTLATVPGAVGYRIFTGFNVKEITVGRKKPV